MARARALSLLLACLVSGCKVERPPPPPGVLTLTATEQVATWVRNFNPLMPGPRWPTQAGIYEPLAIYNTATGQWVPWLATAWAWSDGSKTLTFTLRGGVQWSDGAPFTARDAVFTFELLRRFPALDQKAVWQFLEGVEAPADGTLVFHFARPFVPGFSALAHQPLVPQHAWAQVEDPVTFVNPNPVGTGPFTEVRLFHPQVYELGKNPRYWQPGQPRVDALRLPAFPGNDQANLALVDGELDWAANYVPAIDRVFLKKDRVHHHAWFPPLGSMVFLYANTTVAPFDDVRVRRALSQAIDRKLVVEVAMSNYTTPADATALSQAFEAWRDPAVVAEGAPLMRLDLAAAAKALDEAGCPKGPDGVRRKPDGTPFTVTLSVVNGWSDWVRAAQVIARGFRPLGIEVKVRLYDQGAWFLRLQEGDFELAIAWSTEGASPWEFYRWLMHPDTVKAKGVAAAGNWHRYGSEAARPVFEALEKTTDEAEAKALTHQLERRFVEEWPAIPLFPNPAWGEFNTTRFEGFPDAEHPYAVLSPIRTPDCLLVLTRLRPVGEGAR